MKALRRSPKNGDLTATTRSVLRIELTTSVDSASPSTSSATISSGLPSARTFSSSGSRSVIALIFSRCSRTYGVLEHRLHRLGVRDEVRRQVALVELQALGDLQLGGERGALLDGDHAVLADGVERLADQVADLRLARGDGADLGDGLALDGRGLSLSNSDDLVRGRGDARAQRRRVRPGGDVAQARGDHGLGEHGGGGGAVARDVVGLGRGGLGELGAQVLERVAQLDLAGDGDTVVGHRRAAELLLQHDVAAARAEGHLDGVGQLVHPALERPARGLVEADLLRHCSRNSLWGQGNDVGEQHRPGSPSGRRTAGAVHSSGVSVS